MRRRLELPVHSFRECGGTSGEVLWPPHPFCLFSWRRWGIWWRPRTAADSCGKGKEPWSASGWPGRLREGSGPGWPTGYAGGLFLPDLAGWFADGTCPRNKGAKPLKHQARISSHRARAGSLQNQGASLGPVIPDCDSVSNSGKGVPSVASRGPSSPVTPRKLLCCAGLEVGGCHTHHLPASYPGKFGILLPWLHLSLPMLNSALGFLPGGMQTP